MLRWMNNTCIRSSHARPDHDTEYAPLKSRARHCTVKLLGSCYGACVVPFTVAVAHLLEAQELDDAERDRRVEAQPALVGANRAVELHAEAAVDLLLPLVVRPAHSELQDAVWLHHARLHPWLRMQQAHM